MVVVEREEPFGALDIETASIRAPRRRRGVVPRDPLVKRLLDEPSGVVTIQAPAGYGKSTTLQLWGEADRRPFVWVHLDRRDDVPVHLLRHLAAALHRSQPLDDQTLRIITGVGRSVPGDLLPAVRRVLTRADPTVVVFDDTHHLQSDGCIEVLRELVECLAPGSQLVLSGRAIPAVPLARRRMDDDLAEIGAADLAMSLGEAADLLAATGIELRADELDDLLERTEGWPGGLHLAALAIARSGGESAERFSGRTRLVADYLVEEVLRGLPDDAVAFLCESSVLDRLDAPTLDELLGRHDSQRRLEALERSGNLFLVPLDDEGRSYRYHHLFGELLRGQLRDRDPELERRLHRRASALYERRGDVDGAIRHAVNATDMARAADLTLRHGRALAFAGRAERLAQWLRLLGDEATGSIPSAVVALGWYGVASADAEVLNRAFTAAEQLTEHGDEPLPDGSPSVEASLAMMRSMAAPDGIRGVLRHTEEVRQAGPPASNSLWAMATAVQGTAYSMLGDHDRARDRLERALPSLDLPMYQAAALAHLAYLDLDQGDPVTADRRGAQALRIADEHDLESLVAVVAVYSIAALLASRRGRLDEATRTRTTAARLLGRLADSWLSPRTVVFGNTVLAEAAIASGERASARSFLHEASRARRREPGAAFLNDKIDTLSKELAEGSNEPALAASPLTAAELRVLGHLPTHRSLQEIADELIISRNTAKTHAVAIYRKLGVSSRSEAVLAARRLGLLD